MQDRVRFTEEELTVLMPYALKVMNKTAGAGSDVCNEMTNLFNMEVWNNKPIRDAKAIENKLHRIISLVKKGADPLVRLNKRLAKKGSYKKTIKNIDHAEDEKDEDDFPFIIKQLIKAEQVKIQMSEKTIIELKKVYDYVITVDPALKKFCEMRKCVEDFKKEQIQANGYH